MPVIRLYEGVLPHFLMQGCRARNTQPASFSFIIAESFENVNSIFIFCRFILNFLKWERPAGRLRDGKGRAGRVLRQVL